jgi:hypothetical protein
MPEVWRDGGEVIPDSRALPFQDIVHCNVGSGRNAQSVSADMFNAPLHERRLPTADMLSVIVASR